VKDEKESLPPKRASFFSKVLAYSGKEQASVLQRTKVSVGAFEMGFRGNLCRRCFRKRFFKTRSAGWAPYGLGKRTAGEKENVVLPVGNVRAEEVCLFQKFC
jgi:hypothetical protein